MVSKYESCGEIERVVKDLRRFNVFEDVSGYKKTDVKFFGLDCLIKCLRFCWNFRFLQVKAEK